MLGQRGWRARLVRAPLTSTMSWLPSNSVGRELVHVLSVMASHCLRRREGVG